MPQTMPLLLAPLAETVGVEPGNPIGALLTRKRPGYVKRTAVGSKV